MRITKNTITESWFNWGNSQLANKKYEVGLDKIQSGHVLRKQEKQKFDTLIFTIFHTRRVSVHGRYQVWRPSTDVSVTDAELFHALSLGCLWVARRETAPLTDVVRSEKKNLAAPTWFERSSPFTRVRSTWTLRWARLYRQQIILNCRIGS